MANESKPKMISAKVTYTPAWLTWVASVTSCLKALGSDCDLADVAGMSGYAFHMCVVPGLCPSGPTMLNWANLKNGVNCLGWAALDFMTCECHVEGHINELTKAHAKTAFELATREVKANRPCVIWGTYVPEFGVVVGVEKDSYIVKSFKEVTGEPQPPIKYDDVKAPGGIYLLAFPNPRTKSGPMADHYAIDNAVLTFNYSFGDIAFGGKAYDKWMEELKAKKADAFGISYNTACYAEGRKFARVFLERLAKRNNSVSADLTRASELYGKASDAMEKMTRLFPFPGKSGVVVDDEKIINEAVENLKISKDSECKAMEILARVASKPW